MCLDWAANHTWHQNVSKKWLHCFLAHIWFCLWETATAAEQRNTFVLNHRDKRCCLVPPLMNALQQHCPRSVPQTNNLSCCMHVVLSRRWPHGPCFHVTLNMQSHASLTASECCLSDSIPGEPQSYVGTITPVFRAAHWWTDKMHFGSKCKQSLSKEG